MFIRAHRTTHTAPFARGAPYPGYPYLGTKGIRVVDRGRCVRVVGPESCLVSRHRPAVQPLGPTRLPPWSCSISARLTKRKTVRSGGRVLAPHQHTTEQAFGFARLLRPGCLVPATPRRGH